jgi:hypothetical protein
MPVYPGAQDCTSKLSTLLGTPNENGALVVAGRRFI